MTRARKSRPAGPSEEARTRRESFEGYPRVDVVAAHVALEALRGEVGSSVVTELVRASLARERALLVNGLRAAAPSEEEVLHDVRARAKALMDTRAVGVLNATGVILHTNLGRAPLSDQAASRLAERSQGYSSIEFDLATGKRGRRGAFVEDALVRLTAAEDALAVNNCASAALLMLSALVRGRRVIVSRGELVEIGGGFRVPDVLAESGALMVEVGTTNKTRAADFDGALAEAGDGAAILSVHPGNFQQTGFVERPALAELAEVARNRGALFLFDLGGGALVDLSAAGFSGEPVVREVVLAGVDVVTFSADKALGGPQGGIAVGKHGLIEKMRRHPLHRAVRMGRLPMTALEATLESYLRGRAWEEVPALTQAITKEDALHERVLRWLRDVGGPVEVVQVRSEMGGGTLAGRTIPSWGLRVGDIASANALVDALRSGDPPVIARIDEGRATLDARTIHPRDDERLCQVLRTAIQQVSRRSERR